MEPDQQLPELELELERVSGQLTVTRREPTPELMLPFRAAEFLDSGAVPANDSPSLPASCSWIFSISMGVVTTTWQVPAPHPASTSPHRGKYLQGQETAAKIGQTN